MNQKMVNNNNNNNINDGNESSHLLLFVKGQQEEEEKRNDCNSDSYDVMRSLSVPALLVFVLLVMVVATSSSLMGTVFGSNNSIILSSLSSSSSSSSSSIINDNANDNDNMLSRTQPVCMGKTNTATYGLVICPNTNDDFTMYGRYPKEICKQKNCEDRGGKYDDSDFQCDPHPRIGSTGCTTNIKCCDIYTPEPVPSTADKNRYGIKYCGKLNAPDGRTVTVPQAIFEANESGRQIVFQVHGIGDVDKKIVADSRQQTLRAFDTYLWGGSCRGKCVKKGGTASCTY
mmetsp:Transcript_41221/g.47538  ORF Transcript_41221/g.47538 Transcript_41221/m.47538 type:complete len:287 (-) Transcript_41221:132-992(-)|eukprot:CAMPEP_0170827144 /NCGR_PEP_ID=MMETSP0733-20121128/47066_1 /TAXON_ID=186038 /ORGANISM="Fragilariopsis kerguelensis, Strain L26-C5" /LENGTH=286 /DNA_ID=CAMNT_0011191211 /DNA_START=65 /DNA_END=922 /DNA_ORIENTATION=-